MGKPVVCLDSGGPGFHVRPAWGIKVAPAAAETVVADMAAAFARLHDDPGLRLRMGRAARARVEDYYLHDRESERLEKIYRLALGRSGKP
ncbi:MAG: glycosyltransferase family 4 protein [Candidatus Aminicenantes bacterium]|nr:glycosyltransferase family 4 protein [Candidatus Aminicenantes bacterium]